jgi:hypothetical protein
MNRDVFEISIDSLVLEGFAPEDAERIKSAVEQELSRLLTEQGVPELFHRTQEKPNVDGVQMGMEHGSDIAIAGRRIARAIYGGMTR